MYRQQRGMTFLGLLILVTFVGLFVYGGIRLTPAYLDYMKVARSLEDLQGELGTSGAVTAGAIRISLEKQFDIEDVSGLDLRDVEITREGDEFAVRAAWDVPAPFVANVSFVVHFDKTVMVPVQ